MTGDAVTGRNGDGARAGARTLNLLAAPLNAQILRALHEGPKQQADLRDEIGHPSQSTLRAQLKKLERAGAIEKRRRNRFPGVLEYELSTAGRDLLPVIAALERWLGAPDEDGPEPGDPTARAAVKALTEGWSSTILRNLGAKALTLTELDRGIESLNYPSVERRLSAMRLACLVEAREGDGRGTPYAVTAWARHGIAPLVAAISWERRHARPATPVGRVEAEMLLLLGAPLVDAGKGASGTCRLAMEIQAGGDGCLAGAMAEVGDGRVRSCTPLLRGAADAWALGSPSAWLDAMAHGEVAGIECGGDAQLAHAIVSSLHRALSEAPAIPS